MYLVNYFFKDISDDDYLPLKVVNELLCRQIMKSTSLHLDNIPDVGIYLYLENEILNCSLQFFKVLNSLSKTVQQTAFLLLHKSIPLMQEQLSINAAIENKQVSLPAALTALLKITPENLNEGFSSTAVKGYLLSWILIFDHFECSVL